MRRTSINKSDVIIIGGGHSGLTLAGCLGVLGVRVVCLERAPKKAAKKDGRTLALSLRSMRLFRRIGVAKLFERVACPILDIRVADQDSPLFLDFHHQDVGDEPFGWIIENGLFNAALETRVKALKSVTMVYGAEVSGLSADDFSARVTLTNGKIFEAALVVGADGRKSLCRELAGIPVYGWSYRQTAIVCTIKHSKPHHNVAVEHFQPGGPFATLPMTPLVPPPSRGRLGGGASSNPGGEGFISKHLYCGGPPPLTPPARGGGHHRSRGESSSLIFRSSIVWTEKTSAAEVLMKMNEKDFTKLLQEKVYDYLGAVKLVGGRFSFPLQLQHARHYTAKRVALIGDAAHGIHPIAGQGFNLGMGDIEVLTEEIGKASRLGLDIGSPDLLRRFEKRRKFDNGNMVLMTDFLDRLFSNAIPPVQAVRRMGLGAVQRLPQLRKFFMRTAMGGVRG